MAFLPDKLVQLKAAHAGFVNKNSQLREQLNQTLALLLGFFQANIMIEHLQDLP